QIHHLRWWRNQGPTDANNLVGLCWYHHRLVHEGGWEIDGNPEHGDLVFTSPLGRTLRSKPNPLRRDTRTRATRAAGMRPRDAEPAGHGS
ncbi:MAG: HNH endonuclease signature motif containing protein, partial [Actinomycetota bacterium]